MQTVLTSYNPKYTKPFMVGLCLDGHILEGRGHTFADAILDLAAGIKDARAAQGDGILAKALNQPLPSVIPGVNLDGTPSKINNVGKIVWYMPGPDDTEQSGEAVPAIITREWAGGRMDLYVFSNQPVCFNRLNVEWSAIGNSRTWDWTKK